MILLQADPPASLRNYIYQYWYLYTEDPSELGHLTQMMFPIDFGGLSFYFSKTNPVVRHYKSNICRQVPAIYTGLITSPGSITFEAKQPIGGFVVAFLPHGFSDLFCIDVSKTTDQLPDFFSLLNGEGEKFYEQVNAAKEFNLMMDVANQYFLNRLPASDNSSQMIEAINQIIQTNGLVDVKELANHVNMSWKSLERHFQTRIGVTPKTYARFKRFHYALSLLNEPVSKSWRDIAHTCGYYDQAHFIKEFREFTNQSPSAFSVLDYPLFYRFIIQKK